MKKIKFTFASKDNDFLMNEDDFNSLRNNNSLSVFTEFIPNNSNSLPKLYNSILDSSINPNTKTCDFDYIVLCHADVKFNLESFVKHLIWIDGKYDMIGLAGTKNLDASASPLNWFVGSNKFQYSRYGDVTMLQDGNEEIRCLYNALCPDAKDTEAVCIDGLCIIISKKLIEKGFRFDESIAPYDFYDTDASFQVIFNHKGKVGVMVEPVFHASEGRGILDSKFLEYEKKFREKWKSNLNIH